MQSIAAKHPLRNNALFKEIKLVKTQKVSRRELTMKLIESILKQIKTVETYGGNTKYYSVEL